MARFVSKREWAPSAYTYGRNLRLRLDLPADGSLPELPQTVWVARHGKGLKVEVSVVPRKDTPWGQAEVASAISEDRA